MFGRERVAGGGSPVHRDAQQFDLRPGQVQRPSTGWEGVHVLQMRGWKVSNPPREPRLTDRLELVPAVPGLPTRQVPGQYAAYRYSFAAGC